MKRLLTALIGLIALAACSSAPITIDVIPLLGDDASGQQQVTVTDGTFDIYLPGEDGQTVSGYNAIQFSPASVSLEYELEISQEGDLSGTAEVTFYMAKSSDVLWDDANKLGGAQELDLGQQSQTVSGTLSLSPAQIDALMSGEFVIGARISGQGTGSAIVSYEFKKLLLNVAFF